MSGAKKQPSPYPSYDELRKSLLPVFTDEELEELWTWVDDDGNPVDVERWARSATLDELVERFNGHVGPRGWPDSRVRQVRAIAEELLRRPVDCSAFIKGEEIWVQHIRLDGDRIVVSDP